MEHFCLTGYFTLWLAAVDALKKYDADARKSAYQRIKSLLTDDFLTSGSALQMQMVLGMGMELQSLVRSPDHSYSDQLAACEKEVSRLREQIAVRAECGAFTD